MADGVGRTLNLSQALEVSWLELLKASRMLWAEQDGAALGRAVTSKYKESTRMFEWTSLEKARLRHHDGALYIHVQESRHLDHGFLGFKAS